MNKDDDKEMKDDEKEVKDVKTIIKEKEYDQIKCPYHRAYVASYLLQKVLKKKSELVMKQKTGGVFKTKYCSLDSAILTCFQILPKLYLGFNQQFLTKGTEKHETILRTSLLDFFVDTKSPVVISLKDKNPEFHSSEFNMEFFKLADANLEGIKKDKREYQTLMHKTGGFITYMRRYCLFVTLGIMPDERAENYTFKKEMQSPVSKSLSLAKQGGPPLKKQNEDKPAPEIEWGPYN